MCLGAHKAGLLSWWLDHESEIGSDIRTVDKNLGVFRIHKIFKVIRMNDFNCSLNKQTKRMNE